MNRLPLSKKHLILTIILIILVLAVIGWQAFGRSGDNGKQTSVTRSKSSGNLTLKDVSDGMQLRDGSPVSGNLKEGTPQGTQIYYVITAKDKKTIGAGSILPDAKHNFSRNLNLDIKGQEGKEATLEVYLQESSGKRSDHVKLDVVIAGSESGS